ncbi:DUF1127 domain-containing protein [Alphaproteobacteria bacterium KMM 3653]|uniref:DUF1127 domain-containing protein n=1 Tax=Harenicola maris TaxID=2841044 RepID=A0AAP2CQ10_9RHOB|nr:DUF1127 domain-containing protein [Harenicola maris]
MVATTSHAPTPLLSVLAVPFRAVGNFFMAVAEASSLHHRVEKLSALSDEELAAKGLAREDIVSHVFRNYI